MNTERVRYGRSIGGKILIIFLIVSIVSVGLVTLVSILKASDALMTSANNQLSSILSLKESRINSMFQELEDDFSVLSRRADIIETIEKFITYHNEMGIGATENFDTTGSGENLTYSYEEVYEKINSQLSNYCEIFGYYDIFLICAKHGHVMYSWAKESDFGTNLSVGEYRDTNLAELWAKVVNTRKISVVDTAAYAPSNGAPAMFAGAPVFNDDDEMLGIVAVQIPQEMMNEVMNERTGLGNTGETYLVGQDYKMRSDSFLDPVNRTVTASIKGTVEKNGVDTIAVREAFAGRPGMDLIIDYNGNPVLSVWEEVPVDDFSWAILAEIDEAEVREPIMELINFILMIAAGILVIVVVVSIFFSRSLSKPILLLAEGAARFAIGDILLEGIEQNRIDGINARKDELGVIGRSFGRLINYMNIKVGLANKIADGDLRVDVDISSEADQLGKALDLMVTSLTDIISQVRMASAQVTSGSDQVSQASQALSQGATEQASSLEEISSSITEINSQSKQNSENATEANTLAKEAAENAESGNTEMKSLTQAMEAINASSDEIKKVVKVIDDIAFQINLLALNANVEAARAGKYGKGFAVVAEEVRNLAVKSATAVKETTKMVDESIRNIDEGNLSVGTTAKQLEKIVGGISKVASFLDEIAMASKEQAQGIDQITDGLDQIEQVTQANTASAEESASASEELAGQAQELQRLISRFKLKLSEERAFLPESTDQQHSSGRVGLEKSGIQKYTKSELDEHGIRPVPHEGVIALDDDDFERF